MKNAQNFAEPNLHPGSSYFVRRLLGGFGTIYGSLFYKTRVEGLENVPLEGSVLVLVKHQRNDDIPLGVGKALFKKRLSVWCVMKDALAKPIFMDFFLKCGGIPVDRKDPRKSKKHLLHARKVLYGGNMVVIFPEQTTVPYKMGRGKPGGFRFILGKPEQPLPVLCLGMKYEPRKGFLKRTLLTIKIGTVSHFNPGEDPEEFLHNKMHEIAALSDMEYTFPITREKTKSADEDETAVLV